MDAAPNQTLYVTNVYEKLRKEETQRCLFTLFSQFGRIVDVVCMKTERLRGQAWIAFADITAATNALRAMQDFPFYDKPLRLQYALGQSDAIARLSGTWKKGSRAGRLAPGGQQVAVRAAHMEPSSLSGGGSIAATTSSQPTDVGRPHNVLFVQNLPEGTTEAMLAVLFKQFPGFQACRLVPGKPGIAFVDFGSDMQAGVAVVGLQGFKVTPSNSLLITYAKV